MTRILVAADEYPWPPRSGYRQRLHWLLTLLATHGSVDLLVVQRQPQADPPGPPPGFPLDRLAVVPGGGRPCGAADRAARWVTGGVPRSLAGRDWRAARAAAAEWSERGYDLVWFAHSPLYLALRDVLPRPHVVDLDNLESSLLHHRRHRGPWRSPQASAAARRLVRTAADRLDERRWARLERRIARTAAVTVVCSELDRRRLGGPSVRVVPNGYELGPDPAAHRGVAVPSTGSAPVLLFVGLLTYEPNRDAAAFFAHEVLPLVRKRIPGARFRVVGRHGPDAVRPLLGLPGVEVLGEVPDIEAELARSSISVAPIRFGGGTRIKILEAFAHGLPVVSTTTGCEGLDVVDRRHLLVADGPEEMAAACCELLEQPALRRSIAEEARSLWRSRYRWTSVAPAVEAVLAAARDAR